MKIRENRIDAVKKIKPLTERLSRQYGIEIDLSSDVNHLKSIVEHYNGKREIMLSLQGETAVKNPSYTKNVLISETVRLFLREIAPKRRKKK